MSATPMSAGAKPNTPQLLPYKSDTQVPAESAQDAFQVLLAFACIHEQAIQRRRNASPADSATDEYFGLDDVLQLVAARAQAITGADGVAIALAKDHAIVCRAAVGRITPDPGIRLDPDSGFSGACLRSGQTIRCDDSEKDSRVNAQACRVLGARSMVAVPLTAKGKVVGLIEAFSSETFGFNDSDVKGLNLLGELILAAIHPVEEDRLAQLAEKILPEPAVISPHQPNSEKIFEAAPAIDLTAAVGALIEEKLGSTEASQTASSLTQTEAPSAEIRQAEMPKPALNLPEERNGVSRVLLVAMLVLVACGLGWAWFRRAEQLTIASTRAATLSANSAAGSAIPELSSPPVDPGAAPEVTGIRHWSSPESSTVVVDLQDQIQYEAHTLENPPRIYFDLYDTKMAVGLLNQSILVDDSFVRRLRMAQPKPGVTRVVLEIKSLSEVSVKLDPNPYRLTIDVHKVPTAPLQATLSKPVPALPPSPALRKPSPVPTAANSEFRIVLDAGHGGWDLGTVGRKGLLEKDLVLDIVQRVGKLLEDKLGAYVTYTRQDDSYLPLEKRAEIANLDKADLFLSVHANYSDLVTARGVETYYTTTYSSLKARTTEDDAALKDVNWTGVDIREKVTNSHRLADDVQQALYAGLVARNPEIRNRGVKEAQYVVLTGTQMPAILAEVSFVSSPSDEDNLQSSEYRQEIAEALYQGVAKYRADLRHTKLASARRTSNSE